VKRSGQKSVHSINAFSLPHKYFEKEMVEKKTYPQRVYVGEMNRKSLPFQRR
jgi:hypothetical protein